MLGGYLKPIENMLAISIEPSNIQELKEKTLRALKNRKAVGIDQINAGLVKAKGQQTSNTHIDATETWTTEQISTFWNK